MPWILPLICLDSREISKRLPPHCIVFQSPQPASNNTLQLRKTMTRFLSKSVSISALPPYLAACLPLTIGKSISEAWHINLWLTLRQIMLLLKRKLLDWCRSKAVKHTAATHIFFDMLKNATDALVGASDWDSTGDTRHLDVRGHKLGIWDSLGRKIRALKYKLAARSSKIFVRRVHTKIGPDLKLKIQIVLQFAK